MNDILPELIWLGLLHDRRGYRFGADTLAVIIEASKSWPSQDKPVNYATQAAFAPLQPHQRQAVVAALTNSGLLEDVQTALAPLTLLYDGFSLSFVGPPPVAIPREILIQRVTESVRTHLDKYETPGIVLNGSLLLTRLIAGTIKFSSKIEVPDFNAVVDRPDSVEAKKAASFMRASALAEFGMLKLSTNWAKHFWNRGAELAPCKLPGYANGW